jgi:hypothetical protein
MVMSPGFGPANAAKPRSRFDGPGALRAAVGVRADCGNRSAPNPLS